MTRRSHRRNSREGMILLNVLVIVAIATAAVVVMISAQDIEVQRTIRLTDASQAQAYTRAAEASAIVALRRDGISAADSDSYAEPWAAVGQREIDIPGGRFAVAIEDEQARFNLNSLRGGGPIPSSWFSAIARGTGVSTASVNQIVTVVDGLGPLSDDGLLRTAGIDPADLDRLKPYLSYLPTDAKLNLNTVAPDLLTLIAGNVDGVRLLSDRRAAKGAVTEPDVAAAGMTGFGGLTSDHFLVVSKVQIGDVTRITRSRLTRSANSQGVTVRVESRRRSSG